MGTVFGREPAVILAFIRALIYLVILFGVNITEEQFAGLIVVVETGMAVWTRANVAPVVHEKRSFPKP